MTRIIKDSAEIMALGGKDPLIRSVLMLHFQGKINFITAVMTIAVALYEQNTELKRLLVDEINQRTYARSQRKKTNDKKEKTA